MKKHKQRTWLMEKRKAAGFDSLRGFAREIGLSPSYYCEIEKGIKNPRFQSISKISSALDMHPADFYAQDVHFKGTKGA